MINKCILLFSALSQMKLVCSMLKIFVNAHLAPTLEHPQDMLTRQIVFAKPNFGSWKINCAMTDKKNNACY